MDGGGDVAQDCMDVALDGIMPLLVWCRCLVAALVVLVEGKALVRAERGEVVAAEDAGLESAGGKESEDTVEIVEEGVLVAVLDRKVVAEGEELLVPFYAGWVDGTHVVVADTLTDVPR